MVTTVTDLIKTHRTNSTTKSQLENCLVLLGHRDFEDLWDAKRREYFIDRHRATFEVLANWFMEGGDLIRPDHIPIDIFLNEIPYYRYKWD